VVTALVHTVLPWAWALAGIRSPYPLVATAGWGAYLPGFTPPLGALLMLFGGLVFGSEQRR
jgi:hypothetical protein